MHVRDTWSFSAISRVVLWRFESIIASIRSSSTSTEIRNYLVANPIIFEDYFNKTIKTGNRQFSSSMYRVLQAKYEKFQASRGGHENAPRASEKHVPRVWLIAHVSRDTALHGTAIFRSPRNRSKPRPSACNFAGHGQLSSGSPWGEGGQKGREEEMWLRHGRDHIVTRHRGCSVVAENLCNCTKAQCASTEFLAVSCFSRRGSETCTRGIVDIFFFRGGFLYILLSGFFFVSETLLFRELVYLL